MPRMGYLELHGVFSITLRAPGAGLLSKVWFPCFALSAGRSFGLVFAGIAGAKGLQRWGRKTAVYRRLQAGRSFLPPVREFNKRICYSAMKRQICSYDMLAVSCHSYTVSDAEGEMYFCNSRCLCLWSMMLVTKPNLPTDEHEQRFVMTLPDAEKRSFDALVELAQWSAANAIGTPESEWLKNGHQVL
jgi:hypothetical protein